MWSGLCVLPDIYQVHASNMKGDQHVISSCYCRVQQSGACAWHDHARRHEEADSHQLQPASHVQGGVPPTALDAYQHAPITLLP